MRRDFVHSEDLDVAVGRIRHWMKFIMKKFARRYFGGIVQGAFNLALLSALLQLRMGKRGAILARKTMIGIIDKTGEMAISINGLASLARQRLKVVNLKSLKNLYNEDQRFRSRFEQFLSDFGNRGPGEFDLASLNWREDHDMLYRVIAAAKDSREYVLDRQAFVQEMLKSAHPCERFMLQALIPRLEVYIPLRENGKHVYLKAVAKTKDQLNVIAQSLVRQGLLQRVRDVYFLTLRDIERISKRELNKRELMTIIAQRKKQWQEYRHAQVPDIIYESGERITTSVQQSGTLSGEPLSGGKIKARARIIADFSKIHRLKRGEILITHHADPGWTPLFTIAAGLIVEVGGVICHAAMVARELGIPALSVPGATSLIRDGSVIELDADEGRVMVS
jgi:pyruvate,water dikinase